jgi:hypothetical protein
MNPAAALTVIERSGGRCEVTGDFIAEGEGHLHHRQLKSRGGRDVASNLIRVTDVVHRQIHDQPKESLLNGAMVGSWQEPEKTRFRQPDGCWVLLADDGSVTVLGDDPSLF